MKLRYLIISLLLCFAVGCAQEELNTLSEIQLPQSYVALDVNGGTESLSFTASESWSIVASSVPDWLVISPMSGAAGEATIAFSANATKATNNAEIQISCGGKTQYINVIQFAAKADPVVITVKDAINLIKSGTQGEGEYYVKGIVCKIDEIDTGSYGNATYYLSDDGTFGDGNWLEVYRGYWIGGVHFATGDEFAVGDELTIVAVLIDYKGTPETNQYTASVVSIKKSLVQIPGDSEYDVPKEGATIPVKVLAKGDALDVTPNEDWIHIKETYTVADTNVVVFAVHENAEDTRTGSVDFTSSNGSATSTVSISFTQASGLNCYSLPFEESFGANLGAFEINDIDVENTKSGYVWSWGGASYGAKASAGQACVSESDLVSPLIDLTKVSSAYLTFDHTSKYAGDMNNEETVWVSKDNGATWTQVLIPVYPTNADWNFVNSGAISLNAFVGNQVKIAFKYRSNASYYATWEVKNVKIVEGVGDIASIAQINNLATAQETAFTAALTDAVVSYTNGGNAFIQDATGGIQLYLSNHGLTAGQKISGEVSGKVKLYSGYAELTSIDLTKATVTEGDAPAPMVMTLEALLKAYLRYQNCLIKLEDVTIEDGLASGDRNGKLTQGESSIALYDQAKTVVIETGAEGDLVCIPIRYNANIQLGVWDTAHFTAK